MKPTAFVLAAMLGCTPPQHPATTPPVIAVDPQVHCPSCMEFPAPNIYSRWWQNVENCSGYAGRMDTLRFYVAPKLILAFSDSGPRFLAYYFGGPHPVVIFGLSAEADSTVVEHEMLHALMDQNHANLPGVSHPAEEKEKCGAQLKNWIP